ncbi:unnamed protein product [Umbelopsis vinacea]
MTWGYQFFDSENSSSTLRMQNHFQDLSISALDSFLNALTAELETSSQRQREKFSNTAADNEPPFARLKQALAQTLSDFRWTDIDVAYLASPGRLRRTPRSMRQMRNGPLETRNHIYVVSSIPQTYSDLMWYFQLPSESAFQTHLTREGDKMTIGKIMDNAAIEMKKILWDGFVDHRISLNWIDIWPQRKEELSVADEDIKRFIGIAFQAIAKIFGGYLIPFSLLHQDFSDEFGISIQNILYHYTSKTIDTSNEFVRNRRAGSSIIKPSLLDVIQSSQLTEEVVWMGELNLDETSASAGDCTGNADIHKLNLIVHNFLRPQLSNSLINMTASEDEKALSIDQCLPNVKCMTGFLLLSAARIPLKWYFTAEDSGKVTSNYQESNESEYNCDTDDLLASIPSTSGADVANDTRVHGTTVFDLWTSDNMNLLDGDIDGSSLLYSIDCEMPSDLQLATSTNTVLQSAMDSALAGESMLITTVESQNDGVDVVGLLDGTTENNDKPETLAEFQSHWIGTYLLSLYLSSVEPESIAGRLQSWVNHLEHSMCIPPSDILAAIKQLPLSFYDFDTKHKELYNASGIVTDELAKHLVEDEVPILEKWKQARQLDSKNLRILKIKEWVIKKCGKLCDAQLQIIVMLKIMQLEKRYMTLNKIELPKPEKKKSKKKKHKAKGDLDQELELYFERLCIWDSMMDSNISTADTSASTTSQQAGTEDTILNLRVLCKYLSDIYRPILPDIIDKLWSRCGGEEEPMLFETDRAQSASSLTKPTPIAEKNARSSKKTPMDANARVKLLESRIRGPSNETLVTDAAWATKGESKQAQKSNSSSINLLSSNRKLPSTTINLPFMKREIEMTKSLSSSSKSKSYSTALTQQKPSGSRRKITTPKKIPIAVMDGKNTETVVLRKRPALSPTTPRTRAERDFGLSYAF